MAGLNFGMLKAAAQARTKQQKYQKLLDEVQVKGTSKNGKVSVTVAGTQKIKNITIDPELIRFIYENFVSKNLEETMLSKSVIEAVDDALSKLQMEIIKKMQEGGNMSELMEMIQGMNK